MKLSWRKRAASLAALGVIVALTVAPLVGRVLRSRARTALDDGADPGSVFPVFNRASWSAGGIALFDDIVHPTPAGKTVALHPPAG